MSAMKRKLIIILASTLLSSCGGSGIYVHEETPIEFIHELEGNSTSLAYAIWDEDMFGNESCDIYLPPKQWTNETYGPACYDALYQHELKHCYDGAYHEDGKGYVEECTRLIKEN